MVKVFQFLFYSIVNKVVDLLYSCNSFLFCTLLAIYCFMKFKFFVALNNEIGLWFSIEFISLEAKQLFLFN